MAAPPQLLNNGGGWIGPNWAEWLERRGTEEASFGYDGGVQATFSIVVRWEDVFEACADILGFATVDRLTGKLKRKLPVKHPLYEWLYAQRLVSVKPYAPTGVKQQQPPGRGAVAVFRWHVITIQFGVPPYAVLSDNQLQTLWAGDESRRFVELREEYSVEVLNRQAGEFRYVEGAAGQPQGQSVPFGVSQLLTKRSLALKWYNVPEYPGIYDSNGLLAKIDPLVGKVNSVAFRGHEAGTLLFGTPVVEPVPMPVDPLRGMDAQAYQQGRPPRQFNLTVPLKRFKPPIGGGGATTVGWNTVVWPGDNRWYLVKDPNGGNTLYETADFANAFTFNV